MPRREPGKPLVAFKTVEDGISKIVELATRRLPVAVEVAITLMIEPRAVIGRT